MTTPTSDEIRAFIEGHVERWNAGDKQQWLDGLQAGAPGGISMEDPVGTPLKRGWQIMGDSWDASPNADWKLSIQKMIICAGEAAVVMLSEGKVGGQPVAVDSIETYTFGADGSLHLRTFLQLPEGSEYEAWTSTTGS